MYGTAYRRGLGDPETDLNDAGDPAGSDAWVQALRAIRSVSHPMAALRQRITMLLNNVGNADVPMSGADFAELRNDIEQLAAYSQQLPALIAYAKSLPEYQQDAQTAAELTNYLAFLQDWAGSTLAIVGQLPTDAANYLAQQVANVGRAAADAAGSTLWAAARALLPVAAVALGLIAVVRAGERTRTGRALARRL